MSHTPRASSPAALRRMRATRQSDTAAELSLRHHLHELGLRYRVNRVVLPGLRRRADIVFSRAKVAVFVDGCFWHSCPIHATSPKANAGWWADKLRANQHRDADTNARLAAQGWLVERVWEHEDAADAARRIAGIVDRRQRQAQK